MLSDTKVIELTLYIVADMRWYAGRRPFAASCGFSEHKQRSWACCNWPGRLHQGKCLHLQMTKIGWPCLLHSFEWFHICCGQAGWPASQIQVFSIVKIEFKLASCRPYSAAPCYCNFLCLDKEQTTRCARFKLYDKLSEYAQQLRQAIQHTWPVLWFYC